VKKSRFSEEKIIAVLRQAEAGVKVSEPVRKLGISEATFYNWNAKYGGLDASQLRRLKELEGENAKLKKMYAELSLTHHALQDAVETVAPAACSELVSFIVAEHGVSVRQACRAVRLAG
jgi:putative transposase